jgi:glycyl-tRNA synthetase beta chain
MTTQNLLVELFVEELPPKALKKLGDAFAGVLFDQLKAQGLAGADSAVTAFASPRRLAAHVTHVWLKAEDKAVQQKLMPAAVGLDASGNATPALLKKLAALGADVSDPAAAVAALKREGEGKAAALFYDSLVTGATLDTGLQKALDEALAKLPIPKVMSYQLESDCELPGWSSVHFVRPAHGLVALHGSTVVPVKALGLTAGNTTHGHRFEAAVDPVVLADADHYAETLLRDGAVLASFNDRRFAIVQQLAQAAERLGPGFEVLMDEALLDEVTALVERPNVLTCGFDAQFLDVPQECLILTMKANQKYFPLVDTQGKLTNQFLVVSNISPDDASAVIGGNERVVRPRLADAKFFFDQDRKKTLASRVEGLGKVVYHNKLGTQGERVERVRAIAKAIGQQLGGDVLAQSADTAANLAKTDLLTDMVGEFPELQGIMGGYYARHDGLGEDIAFAIEDHYKPRFAGDEVPRTQTGAVVALADKLETLVGMFGIGNLPTGDKDPFALRRHALGVIGIVEYLDLAAYLEPTSKPSIDVLAWLGLAAAQFEKYGVADSVVDTVYSFILERQYNSLTPLFGHAAVSAVLELRPSIVEIVKRVQAVREFEKLPEAPALAAANKRIGNILKKSGGEVAAAINASALVERAEKDLYAAMQATVPAANAKFDAGDYTASLQALAALRVPVDAFFDGVMVNAEDAALKANRLGLLKNLHEAMNRVADLSRLAA